MLQNPHIDYSRMCVASGGGLVAAGELSFRLTVGRVISLEGGESDKACSVAVEGKSGREHQRGHSQFNNSFWNRTGFFLGELFFLEMRTFY